MNTLRIPVHATDHILGPPTARLTLVEYGDFQCPFCVATHPRLKNLVAAFGADLRLVFRHFPLAQAHEFALLGAQAAEAADRQAAFWPMHDMLFEQPDKLGPEGVFQCAGTLKLDLELFQSDLYDPSIAARIQDDFMGGVRSGVNGTPSFFLNGAKLAGLPDAATLVALVEESGASRGE